MGKKLKIGVACGGTGGHIFPGLATARELLERGHDVTLWMAGKDVESDAVGAWTGRVVTIPSEGFQFGLSLRSLVTVARLYKAYRKCLLPMRKDCPDVLLAMGSYSSFGPAKAATKLGVPYVMHEANLIPGRAVSFLARKANCVGVSFEKTRFYLKHSQIETTGMPLRKELQLASEAPRKERDQGAPLRILVMGGSRGAQVLNETVPPAIIEAVTGGAELEVEHVAGLNGVEDVRRAYADAGIVARVHPFVQRMEELYLNCDFAICRSGAASCAELAAFGVPALFVPYPFAIRDHQMGNARIFQDVGAADVVAQDDLSVSWLADYLTNVSGNPERFERMAEAMKKRAQSNAATSLADLVERIGGK